MGRTSSLSACLMCMLYKGMTIFSISWELYSLSRKAEIKFDHILLLVYKPTQPCACLTNIRPFRSIGSGLPVFPRIKSKIGDATFGF